MSIVAILITIEIALRATPKIKISLYSLGVLNEGFQNPDKHLY